MYTRSVFPFLSLIITVLVFPSCQNYLTHSWTTQNAGQQALTPVDVQLDQQNNSINVGSFTGAVDFATSQGVATTLLSNGGNDIFVQKLDAGGAQIWAKTFGGPGTDLGTAMALDNSDNIYVAGVLSGQFDLDPSPSQTVYGSSSTNYTVIDKMFLMKLDPNGDFVWVRTWDIPNLTPNTTSSITGINVDGASNLYLCGFFWQTTDFNNNPGSSTPMQSNGHKDVFVMKLNSAGYFQWVNTAGGAQSETPTDIAVSGQNEIYVTGWYETGNLLDTRGFVQKFSPNFVSTTLNTALLWTKDYQGSGTSAGYKITADAQGNAYILGIFKGTVDFNTDLNSVNTLFAPAKELFVNSLDVDGDLNWTQQFSLGPTAVSKPGGVRIDNQGNLFFVTATAQEISIRKLGQNGQLASEDKLSYQSQNGTASIADIAVNDCGISLVGKFQMPIDFDPDPADQSIISPLSPTLPVFISRHTQSTSQTTSVFLLETASGQQAEDFCDGEDIFLNGSASTNEDAYSIEVSRRPINSPGSWQGVGTIGWTTGQVGKVNLSNAISINSSSFGYEYRVVLLTQKLPCFSRVESSQIFTVCNR